MAQRKNMIPATTSKYLVIEFINELFFS